MLYNTLEIKEDVIQRLQAHNHAETVNLFSDTMGKTENDGCPETGSSGMEKLFGKPAAFGITDPFQYEYRNLLLLSFFYRIVMLFLIE